jgi:hypothetical protein
MDKTKEVETPVFDKLIARAEKDNSVGIERKVDVEEYLSLSPEQLKVMKEEYLKSSKYLHIHGGADFIIETVAENDELTWLESYRQPVSYSIHGEHEVMQEIWKESRSKEKEKEKEATNG